VDYQRLFSGVKALGRLKISGTLVSAIKPSDVFSDKHVHIKSSVDTKITLWLFNIAMEAMAHRNR